MALQVAISLFYLPKAKAVSSGKPRHRRVYGGLPFMAADGIPLWTAELRVSESMCLKDVTGSSYLRLPDSFIFTQSQVKNVEESIGNR